MNWCMVGICGGCIPLLLLFKERYSRSQLDAANRQAKRRVAVQVVEDEETPLLSSVDQEPHSGNVAGRNRTSNSEV